MNGKGIKMTKKIKESKEVLCLVLPKELKDKIRRYAKKNDCSLNKVGKWAFQKFLGELENG